MWIINKKILMFCATTRKAKKSALSEKYLLPNESFGDIILRKYDILHILSFYKRNMRE